MEEKYKFVEVKQENKNPQKSKKVGFKSRIFLPFFCGMLGSAVVIGTCFGVPQIKNKIINTPSTLTSTQNNSGSNSSANINAVSLTKCFHLLLV